jgi:hypothetical protein
MMTTTPLEPDSSIEVMRFFSGRCQVSSATPSSLN